MRSAPRCQGRLQPTGIGPSEKPICIGCGSLPLADASSMHADSWLIALCPLMCSKIGLLVATCCRRSMMHASEYWSSPMSLIAC